MADKRLDPRGIKPSTTDGDVLTTAGGIAAWGPPVLPAAPSPMVSIDENGFPGLIFDEDGNIVCTEG